MTKKERRIVSSYLYDYIRDMDDNLYFLTGKPFRDKG